MEDLDAVRHAWPAGVACSILITSRDITPALDLTTRGLQIRPFDTSSGAAALLNILQLGMKTSPKRKSAMAISSEVGGLPLALYQTAGFVLRRRMSLKDFLTIYRQRPAEVDSKGIKSINYNHTLATVWETALDEISGNARILHMILSFLNSDGIHEDILKENALLVKIPVLDFMTDELEYVSPAELSVSS